MACCSPTHAQVAEALGETQEDVARRTTAVAQQFFRLPDDLLAQPGDPAP
jgi:hypothetical protein